MAPINLTPNQVEYLSWKIMAEVLQELADEVVIADLHPGDGQYDCLSLLNSAPEIVLMLNRLGTSASSGDNSVHDIWERAALKGERETSLYILSELDLFVDENSALRNKELINICNRIAHWLRSGSKGKGKAHCCWIDSPYGTGPAENILTQVKVPESWKSFDAPYRGSGWQALIYALTLLDDTEHEKVVALVHMKTGEAITPDGSAWMEWTKKLSVLPKLVQKQKVTLPLESPSSEAIALFRKVKNFDGYKVFGDDLNGMALAVTQKWYEEKTLPADVNQVKGTLFLMWRKTRFIDGYPGEEDMPFLQALADAIDAAEKQSS